MHKTPTPFQSRRGRHSALCSYRKMNVRGYMEPVPLRTDWLTDDMNWFGRSLFKNLFSKFSRQIAAKHFAHFSILLAFILRN